MLSDEEEIARLIFHDQMIDPATGKLTPAAFPTEELIEKIDSRTGRAKSSSVDRCKLLQDVHETLCAKASTLENPEKNRAKWGYTCQTSARVRSILGPDNRSSVFNVFADAILDGDEPLWDHAHAKLVRAKSEYGKGFVRGYRDQLIQLFEERPIRF